MRIELLLPEVVLDELRRVLSEKLGFSEEQSRTAVELLGAMAHQRPPPPEQVDPISGDPAETRS